MYNNDCFPAIKAVVNDGIALAGVIDRCVVVEIERLLNFLLAVIIFVTIDGVVNGVVSVFALDDVFDRCVVVEF